MEKLPTVPKIKDLKVEAYVRECHKRIWNLCRIIDPNVTGDCLEVADKIINERNSTKS